MPDRPPLTAWQAWLAWTVAALFFFYAFVLRVSPSVMVGELMAEFQVGGAVFGTLSSLYFYTYAPLQLPAGMLMDRYGPRRLITAAVAGDVPEQLTGARYDVASGQVERVR